MKLTGRGALALGMAAVAVAAVAAAFAWWRWERVGTVAGDIPLPPGSQVVRTVYASAAKGEKGPCTIVIRSPKDVGYLQRFFRRSLAAGDWDTELDSSQRMRLRKGGRILRLMFHRQKKRTVFTLNIKPCRRQ